MDALQLIVGLFLVMAQDCTHKLPDVVEKHMGMKVMISNFHCVNREFKVYSRFCEEGQGFWSRPFLLMEENTGAGLYMNKFGEIQASQQASFNQVYLPPCGV